MIDKVSPEIVVTVVMAVAFIVLLIANYAAGYKMMRIYKQGSREVQRTGDMLQIGTFLALTFWVSICLLIIGAYFQGAWHGLLSIGVVIHPLVPQSLTPMLFVLVWAAGVGEAHAIEREEVARANADLQNQILGQRDIVEKIIMRQTRAPQT